MVIPEEQREEQIEKQTEHKNDHAARNGPGESSGLLFRIDETEQPLKPAKPSKNGAAKRAAKRKPKRDHSKAFAAWWEAYPRRVAKRAASDAYAKAVQRIETEKGLDGDEAAALLLERTQAYAESPAGQSGQYTPHPATWLNRGSYDDDPSEWKRRNGNGATRDTARYFEHDPSIRHDW